MAAAVLLFASRTLGTSGVFSRTSRLFIKGLFDRAVGRRLFTLRTRTHTPSVTQPTKNRPKKKMKMTRHFLQFLPSPKCVFLELPLNGLKIFQFCMEAFSELLQGIRINRNQKRPRDAYTTYAPPTVVIDSTERCIKTLCYF